MIRTTRFSRRYIVEPVPGVATTRANDATTVTRRYTQPTKNTNDLPS